MPRARKELVDLHATPYYHCMTCCVRQMYLCGRDKYSGENFEHRRQWIVDRIKLLAENFSIGICAYAIMHNHYHIILKVDTDREYSDAEVIRRWCNIYKCRSPLIKRHLAKQANADEKRMVKKLVTIWRERLQSISWFMRALNENIARRANKESGHRGHFWQSRFKSQALLDDFALLGCMAYVDLNPVRAKIADNLEDSDYTSIQKRLRHLEKNNNSQDANRETSGKTPQPEDLLPLTTKRDRKSAIPLSLTNYIKLVDWTGSYINPTKRGHIQQKPPRLIEHLNLEIEQWITLAQRFENSFANSYGKASRDSFQFGFH